MGDVLKRKRQKIFPFRKVFLLVFLLIGVGSIIITVFYAIPYIAAFLGTNSYISPLASKFSLHEALGGNNDAENIKTKLKKAGFKLKEVKEFDEEFMVLLAGGEKVILSKKKSIDTQISSLQLISSRFTIEGKHFVQLDLRFDRPVVIQK